MTESLRDRLALNAERVEAMAARVEAIVALPDPVGEEIDSGVLRSGLEMQKAARAARRRRGDLRGAAQRHDRLRSGAVCLKSGNAIVLRGSSYAERSNGALAALGWEALAAAALPERCVELLSGRRESLPSWRRPRGWSTW